MDGKCELDAGLGGWGIPHPDIIVGFKLNADLLNIFLLTEKNALKPDTPYIYTHLPKFESHIPSPNNYTTA